MSSYVLLSSIIFFFTVSNALLYPNSSFEQRLSQFCCLLLSCSVMSNSEISWPVASQAPQSMGFFQTRILELLPFAATGDFPDPGLEPMSPVSLAS